MPNLIFIISEHGARHIAGGAYMSCKEVRHLCFLDTKDLNSTGGSIATCVLSSVGKAEKVDWEQWQKMCPVLLCPIRMCALALH